MAMKRGIAAFAAGLAQSILVAFVAILVPASAHADWYQPVNLMSLDDLDGIVAEEYASLTNFAFIYPPRTMVGTNVCFSHIELWGGWYTFSPEGGVAGVTNYIQPTLHYGIPMWKLAVIETADVSRVWLYLAPDGTSFATNDTPASLDPQQWVRDVYRGGPPSYLSSAEADEWYGNRDRSRFAFSFTLISSNDWPQLIAAMGCSCGCSGFTQCWGTRQQTPRGSSQRQRWPKANSKFHSANESPATNSEPAPRWPLC